MIPHADLTYEFALCERGQCAVAGLDEAGRGAWAGPVVAGAVILPLDRFDLAHALDGVNDSKLLTPEIRAALLPVILEVARAAGMGYATHTEIDTMGIVPATRLAMRRALDALDVAPDGLLTDAMPMPELPLPYTSLIKGDQKSLSIAAASIIAKVTRDRFMDELADSFPQYGFEEHKGYGTALHRHALQTFGPCPAHRMSFAPLRAVLESDRGATQE
ncbi:MAG TPA: ribonuclease HII [Aggregatilinea sp.]|uniref:ribonuclease HII n=1 Tax=Aggregatilinea sp. TaxID=2806333 RepID=UPI002CF27175|nr:ribonuclease HII [Aggregatilinea sp.]HML24737.1 ribonuclease HII [Aggregatilinea sp.]